MQERRDRFGSVQFMLTLVAVQHLPLHPLAATEDVSWEAVAARTFCPLSKQKLIIHSIITMIITINSINIINNNNNSNNNNNDNKSILATPSTYIHNQEFSPGASTLPSKRFSVLLSTASALSRLSFATKAGINCLSRPKQKEKTGSALQLWQFHLCWMILWH